MAGAGGDTGLIVDDNGTSLFHGTSTRPFSGAHPADAKPMPFPPRF
jgi:hypothetical protein